MFVGLKYLDAALNKLPDDMTWRGLPGDALLPLDSVPAQQDLGKVRDWAIQQGLVTDLDQLITEEVVEEVSKLFTLEDRLCVGIEIRDLYLEYPVVPMQALITKRPSADIVYWAMARNARRPWAFSQEKGYRPGVRFGFWLPGTSVEFVSVSDALLVGRKFQELTDNLSNQYPRVELADEGHIPGQ